MLAYRQLLKEHLGGMGLLLCLLFFWASLPALSSAASGEPVGKAESVGGIVLLEREGRSESVKAGTPVFLRDKLQTKADSGVEIVFVDGSRVRMAADTVLEITEYVYRPAEKTREGFFTMLAGKARFLVADLQDFKDKRFRVQAQTAVVGTRDTGFCVWIVKESVKTLCLENVVTLFQLSFPDKPVILTANMISQVTGRNLPMTPRFATPQEWEAFIRGVEKIGGKTLRSRPGGLTAGQGAATTLPTTTVPSTSLPTTSTSTSTTTTTTSTTTTLRSTTTTTFYYPPYSYPPPSPRP